MSASSTLLVFVFTIGMFFGMYIGNKRLRRAVNGMFRNSDDDEWEDDD